MMIQLLLRAHADILRESSAICAKEDPAAFLPSARSACLPQKIIEQLFVPWPGEWTGWPMLPFAR